jgi:hypothetical protein
VDPHDYVFALSRSADSSTIAAALSNRTVVRADQLSQLIAKKLHSCGAKALLDQVVLRSSSAGPLCVNRTRWGLEARRYNPPLGETWRALSGHARRRHAERYGRAAGGPPRHPFGFGL